MSKRATLLTSFAFVLVWTTTASVAAAAAAAGKNNKSNGRQNAGAWYDRSLWSDPVSTSMLTQPASERKGKKRNQEESQASAINVTAAATCFGRG
jgi:hypothetical protein